VGRWIQIDRVVLRVAAAYTAIVAIVLLALGAAAFMFIARVDADELRPILDLPEGAFVYNHALVQAGLRIGAVELGLLIVVAVAAYFLALISTRPLREAQEREQRFATEAAHELRTPLARIATTAQGARGGNDAEREKALGAITKMAIDASALIGDLLTLARVEHVPSSLFEPVDISALAREVAADLGSSRPGVQIAVTDSDGVFVDGDTTRLQRLLANLVENAVRHSKTHVSIEVSAVDQRAMIAVDDDGNGVAPELREQIFERFVTTTSGGTGLGLPICRWIARAHGGDINLVTGSRFVVDLPLFATDDFATDDG
jgi:signal transduction histidine kinase